MGELHRERVYLDPEAFSWSKHRTPGLHLSDIVRDICSATGQLPRREEQSIEQAHDNWLQGFLWEEAFRGQLRDKMRTEPEAFGIDRSYFFHVPELAVGLMDRNAFAVTEPGTEIPKGYILMSPDGGCTVPWALLELKHTQKSINFNPHKDRPDWFYAVMGYLEGMSRVYGATNDVFWYVNHPCGDWMGAEGQIWRWWKHFSDGEIADNWAMIANHAYDRVNADAQHPWSKWL